MHGVLKTWDAEIPVRVMMNNLEAWTSEVD